MTARHISNSTNFQMKCVEKFRNRWSVKDDNLSTKLDINLKYTIFCRLQNYKVLDKNNKSDSLLFKTRY